MTSLGLETKNRNGRRCFGLGRDDRSGVAPTQSHTSVFMREGPSLIGCADTVVNTKPAASFHASLSTGAYSDDVDGRFQRDVNGHSGHVNKVGAQRRWDYNHARHLRD